jgi:hypothetical protein
MDLPQKVIRRFLAPVSERVARYLDGLNVDNDGIARRGKFADRIEHEVLPKARKLIRTGHLPSLLWSEEQKYMPRVLWPASRRSRDVLFEMMSHFERDLSYPKWQPLQGWTDLAKVMEWLGNEYSLKWNSLKTTTSYRFDATGLDLSKGAGLPMMGPKRAQLGPAEAFVNSNSSDAFAVLIGCRTQQSDPKGPPKTRGIWGDPISEWYREIRSFRSAIEETVQHCLDGDICYWYTDEDTLLEWLDHRDWTCAVVLDSTQFDKDVSVWEQAMILTYLAPESPDLAHIIDHAVRSPVLLPDRTVLQRYGGMASGKVFTNIGDGSANVLDILWVLHKMGILKYVSGIVVNGDDVIILFTTMITESNLQKFEDNSTREINPDKCGIDPTGAVFGKKIYLCREGTPTWTRSVFLLLNRLMFTEHVADPAKGTHAYIAIATAAILEPLKNYTWDGIGEKIAGLVKAVDKYPIEQLAGTDELKQAASLYAQEHAYKGMESEEEFTNFLIDSSFYGSIKPLVQ